MKFCHDLNKHEILRNVTLVIAILIVLFCIMQTNFAANTTINPGNGTISSVLGSVNNGETLTLDPGNYSGIGNRGITITNKNITIRGNGSTDSVIIDAQNNNRIFNLIGSRVTFINITFTNGNASYGGAISSDRVLSIINCTFINNTLYTTSTFGGGAISLGVPTQNTSSGVIPNDLCSIVNCTFINNTSRVGGGAFYSNIDVNFSFINSTFIDNSAETGGGAVFLSPQYFNSNVGTNSSSNVKITDCIFLNNKACYGGGVNYSYSANLVIINSTFIGNSAERPSSSNLLHGSGGGFSTYLNTNVSIIDCKFFNNSAEFNGGELVDLIILTSIL